MLIDFSVTNFRSFRETQTLSMVAASRLKKGQNTFRPEVEGETLPELLKVAVIYGPNASGKSNLLCALDAVRDIVVLEPTAKLQKLPVTPFRFDPALMKKPSVFEINFVAGKQRYRFTLGATQERITEERLIAFPKGRETQLYFREHISGTDEYEFGAHLEGDDTLHNTWARLTGPQRLFLAQAVANSNESLKQLRPPLTWLDENLRMLPRMPMKTFARVAQRIASEHPDISLTEEITSFVRQLDIPIKAMRFDKVQESVPEPIPEIPDVPTSSLDSIPKVNLASTRVTLTHNSALGDATFEFEEESEGTQNLVGFYLPWTILTNAKGTTDVLAIDEFDSSLHPQIVAELVRRHINLTVPRQLIFTTHDTHLMDTKILRRDQLWITERDKNGATRLHSIHDFEGREGEDVEKRYFEGRYRGLPILLED